MENAFKAISAHKLTGNVFRLIGKDWMLITAGNMDSYNTMTASWGGMGVLWGKDVCFCVIRPHRHTFNFMEKADGFTLCFFNEEYRDALNLCGSKSGRDIDKAAVAGITPMPVIEGTNTGGVYFNEARLVIVCRKIYYQDLDPANFLDPGIAKNYPGKDYHRMYIGEVLSCMKKPAFIA